MHQCRGYAYNAINTWGLTITNCSCTGATRGFNNDTWPNVGLALINNDFDMALTTNRILHCYGILLQMNNSWCRLFGNTITLHQSIGEGLEILRCAYPPYYQFNGIQVDHNTVLANGVDDWLDPLTSWGFNLNSNYNPNQIPIGVQLEHNNIDSDGQDASRLVNLVPPSVGYMAGNMVTVNGAPGNWPVIQPNAGYTYTPYRADLTHNDMVNILLQDAANNIETYSLSGSAAQNFYVPPNQLAGSGWNFVGSGDFNMDGDTDLIFYHAQHGFAYWGMRFGVMVAAGPLTYAGNPIYLPGTFKVVAIADFDGDGKPDFLVQAEDTQIGVWHFDGTALRDCSFLSRSSTGGYPGKWRAVGTGDFDFDGKTDILLQYDRPGNLSDGSLGVWFMNDTSYRYAAALEPGISSDPADRVVATGDYYRGCKSDIVFQYKNPRTAWGGALSIWEMNTTNRIQRQSEASVTGLGAELSTHNVIGPR